MFESLVRRYERGVVGLPKDGKFIAVSNSELKKLACRRQFFFSEVENLKAPPTRRMDAGNAWDRIIGDIYTWWMVYDRKYPTSGLDDCVWCGGAGQKDGVACEPCDGTGDSVVVRVMRAYHEQHERELETRTDGFTTYPMEEIEKTEEALRRMLDGYLVRFQGGPLQSMKIVAVQPLLARQIVNPRTGKPLRAQAILEELDNGDLRFAGPGALARGAKLKKVSWPWLLVGALDALAADRVTKMGTVIDAKQSTQPSRYHDGIQFDPQLPGYCWLVEAHLQRFGLTGVEGFLYDVTNAKFQPDPDELQWKPPKVDDMKAMCAERQIDTKGFKKAEDYQKALGIEPGNGGFSKNQKSGVPSWRYLRAVKAAGLNLDDYQEHIDFLADTVDRTLYRRDAASFGADRRERFGREVFAKASLAAALRKQAVALPSSDAPEVDVVFDREPICTAPGGTCSYKGPCSLDAPETRAGYDQAPSQQWGEDITSRAPSADAPDTDADIDAAFDW